MMLSAKNIVRVPFDNLLDAPQQLSILFLQDMMWNTQEGQNSNITNPIVIRD
jgi:hypothetical protein